MDGVVATVQEDEMWPDEHGNLETSLEITDSPVNDEDIPTSGDDNDFSATSATLECGLEMTTEELQGTADIEKPIYPDAGITNATSMLLIMTFAVVHKLSGEALKDLL